MRLIPARQNINQIYRKFYNIFISHTLCSISNLQKISYNVLEKMKCFLSRIMGDKID